MTTYFFICSVKLEVQSHIQLRCIRIGAMLYVHCTSDTRQDVWADTKSICQTVPSIISQLTLLQHIKQNIAREIVCGVVSKAGRRTNVLVRFLNQKITKAT